MLKELLPKLSPQPEQNPQLPNDPLNLSPNLLDAAKDKPTFQETLVAVQNSIFIKLPIILIQVIFLCVVGVNFVLNKQIDRYVKSTDSLVTSIKKFDGLDAAAKQVTRKLSLYQTLVNSRPDISKDTSFLIETIPSDIKLKAFAYKNGIFVVKVEVSNPFSLAMLISTYFENKNVKEIVIKEAVLQNTTKTYVINFDVIYK